jgi:hypothetical protein
LSILVGAVLQPESFFGSPIGTGGAQDFNASPCPSIKYIFKRKGEGHNHPMFTRGFMLDTSAINRIHDWQQCEWSLRGPLYVTDIQLQEIARTRDPGRRASLLGAFMSLRPTVLRPRGRVFVPEFFGFPDYFEGGFGMPDEDYGLSLGRAMPLIAASMGRRAERFFPDALIAEAALTSNLTLVTADRRLARVGREFGAHVEEIP